MVVIPFTRCVNRDADECVDAHADALTMKNGLQIVLTGKELLRKYENGPDDEARGGFGEGGEGREYSEEVWLPLYDKKMNRQIVNKISGATAEIHIRYKLDRSYDPVEALQSMNRALMQHGMEKEELLFLGRQLFKSLRKYCLKHGYNIENFGEAMDQDGSGTLDRDELRAGLNRIGAVPRILVSVRLFAALCCSLSIEHREFKAPKGPCEGCLALQVTVGSGGRGS